MNESHISLAKFSCSANSDFLHIDHEQKANVSFWTPDKAKLPFYANWETSELYVDHTKEVYKFNKDSLVQVDLPSSRTSITEGEKFNKLKRSLEPYRKFLAEIGQNNSCHKCEEYFNKHLVQKAPGAYSTVATPADSKKVKAIK